MEPIANVKIKGDAFAVTVGPGYYEIYIDKKPVYGYLRDGQSRAYAVADGEHEIGVYSQGRFVAQAKHVFGEEEAQADAPVEEAADKPAQEEPRMLTLDELHADKANDKPERWLKLINGQSREIDVCRMNCQRTMMGAPYTMLNLLDDCHVISLPDAGYGETWTVWDGKPGEE